MDKDDPNQTNKYPVYKGVPSTLPGDMIVPVYSSHLSWREVQDYIEQLQTKFSKRDALRHCSFSRAVCNVKTGTPMDPQKEESWMQASLVLRAELEGDFMLSNADRTGIGGNLVFSHIVDPGWSYLGDNTFQRQTALAKYSCVTPPT